MVGFLPHTSDEQNQMLSTIGVKSIDALFSAIPENLQSQCTFNSLQASGLDELELQKAFQPYMNANKGHHYLCFAGGGAYQRFIPPAVAAIAGRSEFYTAYTPYQPEVSQGTLQMIYEFQTMMSELTGMDVTNASVYDGASSFSEAALMALRITRKKALLVSKSVHPHFMAVLTTYTRMLDNIEILEFSQKDSLEGICQDHGLQPKDIAGVLVQQPDYYGFINDLSKAQSFTITHPALLIVAVDPFSLSVIEPPSEYGADIVCGDIQQFGNSINYGGPYGGFVSTRQQYVRQIPGRLVGRTLDSQGQTAYTLTMQTREQHIRRDKATSNICTNQSLNVLKATAYLSLVGPVGLKKLSHISISRAHKLASLLCGINDQISLYSERPYLNEFTLKLPVNAQDIIALMAKEGIIAGISAEKYWPSQPNLLIIAVTEMIEDDDLDKYVTYFKDAYNQAQILDFVDELPATPPPGIVTQSTSDETAMKGVLHNA